MPLIPDRWARVRLRYAGPYARVRFDDDRGRQLVVHWNWSESPSDWQALEPIRERLAELARELPEFRPGPHGVGPVPLAVFLELPAFLWLDPKPRTSLERALVAPALQNRVQFVLSAPRRAVPRTPFSLPLDIVTAGSDAVSAIAPLRGAWWAQQSGITGRGLQITDIVETDQASLETTLRARERDVLVTSDLRAALAVCGELTTEFRPRLIIAIDSSAELVPPPPGIAVVLLTDPFAADRVGEILFGFVHDCPIHEAVKVAMRKLPSAHGIEVIADPLSNQSLRMRDALIQLSTAAQEIELTLPSVPLEPIIRSWQIKRAKPPVVRQWYRVVTDWFGRRREKPAASASIDLGGLTTWHYDSLTSLRREAIEMRTIPVNYDVFTQESTGLVPMTNTMVMLERINSEATELLTSVHAVTNDRELIDMVASSQNRVIDVAMQRIETEPFLSFVQPSSTLQAGATYRLRVHVGNRAEDSLVTGAEVPIDPLLPLSDPDDRQLDIVVQPKDFTAVTAVQKPLRLPRLGASRPIYFRVRAPEQSGLASLRVHAYYKNHLVQSFLFEAQVDSQEGETSEQRTQVSLVYTRVDRLVLDEVQPRALSIAVNSNGSNTHGLAFKSDGTAGELPLPVGRYTKPLEDYRSALDYAARDSRANNRGKVYPELPPGDPVPEELAEIVRALARVGRNLYIAFLGNADDVKGMRDRLERLKGESDEKLQVVRFDSSFVVPWTILYDRWWPDANWQKAPVCLGVVNDGDGKAKPCAHTETSEVICARGFWGIRHYVEELIGRGDDKHVTVPRPASGAIRFVCGDETLSGAASLEKGLQKFVPASALALGPTASKPLLELLWRTPPERPSILIVLGHVESSGSVGDYPRVVLTPMKEWLTHDGLANRATGPKWGQPRSIVMLMGCESAATSPETVNNFVSTLWLAGAAAVVGTESVIADRVAAKGAERLTQLLWSDKKSLGEAMTTLRRELLATGSPLAFVFNAVGSVDVALDSGASA
jgi:hypothetical protein